MMKQIEHGTYEQNSGCRFYLRTLRQYRRTLRIGQQVRLVMTAGENENTKKKILRGKIKAIYPHIAVVEYPITVVNSGVKKEIDRRESFTLKELMIWNMGKEPV